MRTFLSAPAHLETDRFPRKRQKRNPLIIAPFNLAINVGKKKKKKSNFQCQRGIGFDCLRIMAVFTSLLLNLPDFIGIQKPHSRERRFIIYEPSVLLLWMWDF